MLNILIPMAGEGSRFKKAGHRKPKPFIDVHGKPMIVRVMENLKQKNARFILVGRKDHLEEEKELVHVIQNEYDAKFVQVDGLTEGTASTVLHARQWIDTQDPLLIANSDQIVDCDLFKYVQDAEQRSLHGSILTFRDTERNPKWSFARLNNENLVEEVQEKRPISEFATVGIYWFSQGQFFVDAAIDMICRNERVNNEFYTCPVYNYMIRAGLKVGIYNIDATAMHGIGTPEDLQIFLNKL